MSEPDGPSRLDKGKGKAREECLAPDAGDPRHDKIELSEGGLPGLEPTVDPFNAVLAVVRDRLSHMLTGGPADNHTPGEIQAMEAMKAMKAEQEGYRVDMTAKFSSHNVDTATDPSTHDVNAVKEEDRDDATAGVAATIRHLQAERMDGDIERQKLLAAEKAASDDADDSEHSTLRPYKQRRISSSQLMVNTKYFMTRTYESPHPELGDMSLGTRSFAGQSTGSVSDTMLNHQFDLISSMSSHPVLMVEFVKYLHPRQMLALYSISRVFNVNWDCNEYYFARILACHINPEAAKGYPWELYKDYLLRNPKSYIDIDYTQPDWRRGIDLDKPTRWSRMILGLPQPPPEPSKLNLGMAWVNMLYHRERQARDIMACLARKGHRVPATMRSTLRKIWVLTDCPITKPRIALVRAWTDDDLFNAQLFFVKLDMMFNDPLYGPGTHDLRRLMLAQPGGPRCLWQLLRHKRFVHGLVDLLGLKVLYDDQAVTDEQRMRGHPVFGVPVDLAGAASREGWGHGDLRLVQPDVLVAIEATRRGLRMDDMLIFMQPWGARDFATGRNLVPTVDELYMSDDEFGPAADGIDGRAGNVRLAKGDWAPRHAMRMEFDKLSREEQGAVLAAEEAELAHISPWQIEQPEESILDVSDGGDEDDDESGWESDEDEEESGGESDEDEDGSEWDSGVGSDGYTAAHDALDEAENASEAASRSETNGEDIP